MDTLEAATFTMDGYAGRLFLDSQFGLAKVHYERALAYTCRTYDPAAADLYLVPAYATEMTASFASRCAVDGRLIRLIIADGRRAVLEQVLARLQG